MRFWDSSAIVPLLFTDAESPAALDLLEQDGEIAVWWATETECISALSRRERDAQLSAAGVATAMIRLTALSAAWREIQPIGRVRQIANRLLRTHPLRASDSLQLAAAIVAAEDQPATLGLVTFDQRLAEAATREGFAVSLPG